MKFLKRKNIEFAVLFGLIFAVLLSFSHFSAACDDLRGSVLRLHILADSDDAEDQRVKLLVRDRILAAAGDVFADNTTLHEAEQAAANSLDRFTAIANEVLQENGFSYTASASVGDSYFETREYDDFTLPAGSYRSLIIRLGSAKGHNWWCVVFPAVCIPAAAGADLSDSASAESAAIAEQPQKYIMRFKAVEVYEDIRKHFEKN